MKVGKYRVDREIGRGGMGSVFLGHDTVLGRQVALKRVGHVPGGATADLARAEREARLAAALNHPHVVAIFDLVADGDVHWLVMEYVEGHSLAQEIRAHGAMSADRAADVLWQAADGLAAAHAAGIVHRDVKPSNILLTRHGQAKLTDFGIARAEADAALTSTGLVTGSPAYLSPEVASGLQATAASDVWALGATLFHALAGRAPYELHDNVLGTMYRIVHEPPPRLPDAGWLTPLLEHTMAPDPAQRWSAAQVRDVLRAGPTGSLTVPVAPTVAPEPPWPAATPGGAPRSRWAWLVAAAVLLIGAGALWLGLRDGEPNDSSANSPSDPTSTSAATSTPATPSSPATPDPQAMEAFVQNYLATVTSDPAAAWQLLTPEFQEASGGFAAYEEFWGPVRSARVDQLEADPAAGTVSYTVTYKRGKGGGFTDQVTLVLEPTQDGFLIAGER